MTKCKGNLWLRERCNHILSTWGESEMWTGHSDVTRTAQAQKIPQERQFLELKRTLKCY